MTFRRRSGALLSAFFLMACASALQAADLARPGLAARMVNARTPVATDAARPNFLVILTDDLDFDEITALAPFSEAALAGQTERRTRPVFTPHLDQLAGDGMVFTQFRMASAVCTPSRYAMLTGQYASRSASLIREYPVTGPANVEFNSDIEPGQWHLARGLQEAGYIAGLVGKWHNTDKRGPWVVRPPIADHQKNEHGPQDPTLPENARRVTAAYEAAVSHLRQELGWDFVSSIYINNANALGLPKPLWETEHNMEWFTAGALKFLEAQRGGDRPFFLLLAPNIPHGGGRHFLDADPRATPEGLVEWHLGSQPSREDVLRRVKAAGGDAHRAWATWLDDGIGVILAKLSDLGFAENTVVILTTDQQSRGKWTCYEGARSPFIVRWPGRVKPGSRNDTPLSGVDFAPTLLELAGAPLPAPHQAIVDGRSFAPLLAGGNLAERPALIEMGYGRALVFNGWKYIAIRHPAAILAKAQATGRHPDLIGRFIGKHYADMKRWPSYREPDQLFNLRDDPMEQNNLAADPQHAAKLAEMRRLLKETLAQLPHAFDEFKTVAAPH